MRNPKPQTLNHDTLQHPEPNTRNQARFSLGPPSHSWPGLSPDPKPSTLVLEIFAPPFNPEAQSRTRKPYPQACTPTGMQPRNLDSEPEMLNATPHLRMQGASEWVCARASGRHLRCHGTPYTLGPQYRTLRLKPGTLKPKPSTPNPKPKTLRP